MSARDVALQNLLAKAIGGRNVTADDHRAAERVRSALATAGYAVVPREPTHAMIQAGCAIECNECHMDCKSGPYAGIYRAMLAAAAKEGEKP